MSADIPKTGWWFWKRCRFCTCKFWSLRRHASTCSRKCRKALSRAPTPPLPPDEPPAKYLRKGERVKGEIGESLQPKV